MAKKRKEQAETIGHPPADEICHFLFKKGGSAGTKEFAKKFGLNEDIVPTYMTVSASMNKYPWRHNESDDSIELTANGKRICRIADLIVDKFEDNPKKIADATMRFLVADEKKDIKLQDLDVHDYMFRCFNLVKIFCGKDDEDPLHSAMENALAYLNGCYASANPKGWEKFLSDLEKKKKENETAEERKTDSDDSGGSGWNIKPESIGFELYSRGGKVKISDIMGRYGLEPPLSEQIVSLMLETDYCTFIREDDCFVLTDSGKEHFKFIEKLLDECDRDIKKFAFKIFNGSCNLVSDDKKKGKGKAKFLINIAAASLTLLEEVEFQNHMKKMDINELEKYYDDIDNPD